MAQKIRIAEDAPVTGNRTKTWLPSPGPELGQFLSDTGRLTEVQERIKEESIAILGGCIDPSRGGQNTGLVLGRVQSGKTSSFTATSALAHDNGFKMVIIIAGTTHLLVDQTTDRLTSDLRLLDPNAFRRWTLCPISDKDSAKASAATQNLRTRIQAISADTPPLFAGIPIVVVMKNKTHLDKLNEILKDVSLVGGVDLARIPTLIVDDEAHMHSPDVGTSETPSAVYQCLRDLLEAFPHRTMLQYTATPQANLLMEIADELSPDFVRVLEPGAGYVGGSEIFGVLPNPLVREIVTTDVPSKPTRQDPCPKSLVQATANFLLVCAIDFILTGQADSRSMLVHSDAKTEVHGVYEHWLHTLCESWQMILSDPNCEIPIDFQREFNNLQLTRTEIVDLNLNLEETVRPVLVKVLLALRLQTVNHKRDVGKVNFNLAPYWIINGGNILGVGYTVVGLVTTHMVRKPGAGMADTIQQRGRFFGYLGDRLSSVRVFVTPTMAKRFQDYSAHEEGLRRSLRRYDASTPEYDTVLQPTLKDWKRLFWLDPAMMPTRKKAQRLMLERAGIEKDGWIAQRRPCPSLETDLTNGLRLNSFVESINNEVGLGWHLSDQWGGQHLNPSTTHLEAYVPLSMIIGFLSEHTVSSGDSGNFFSAIMAIEETHLDLENETGLVLLMAQGADREYRRTRSIPIDLFQGRGDGRGQYVGDRKVADPSRVTLQIHLLNLVEHESSTRRLIRKDSTTVAIRLPVASQKWIQNILKQP